MCRASVIELDKCRSHCNVECYYNVHKLSLAIIFPAAAARLLTNRSHMDVKCFSWKHVLIIVLANHITTGALRSYCVIAKTDQIKGLTYLLKTLEHWAVRVLWINWCSNRIYACSLFCPSEYVSTHFIGGRYWHIWIHWWRWRRRRWWYGSSS